jgi:AraC family transcriptional regulator
MDPGHITHITNPGVVTYPEGATFGPRSMRDYEFVWIIEGDCEYRYGDLAVPAPPGSIVLCRPGNTDFFRWDTKRRTRHAFFHFQVSQLPAHWPAMDQWPLVRVAGDGDILRPLFRHVLRWAMGGDQTLVRLSIAHMLTAFVLEQIDTGEIPHDALPEPVERAWAFIQKTLDQSPAEAITLDDLADAGCVTREHLCRVFADATGHSPMETVRLARLDRALNLLARSNYSIGQIAEFCGFASSFHFSRVFKEAFGKSPRALRERIRQGATPPTARLMMDSGRVSDVGVRVSENALAHSKPDRPSR